jgi:dolichol-phosphate mannosyltransferase
MPQLSVIVPALNEADNVRPIVERLEAALQGLDWEVIIVDDDSGDGTADLARVLAQSNPRVRVIQRLGRRGLASACMEGMLASSAPFLAVIDADLQHDESILPHMLKRLMDDDLDVVVGSRNLKDGGMGQFSAARQRLSQFGRRLSRLVCHCNITDPMSGFFIVHRRLLDSSIRRMSGVGFKVLLDMLASSPQPVRLAEMAYTFRLREHGASKLDSSTLFEFIFLLADKLIGEYVPTRFVLFALSGLSGLVAHLAILGLLFVRGGTDFLTAQMCATAVAMTFNFLANNWLTFRSRRLKGVGIVKGLLTFYAACSVGAVTNLALSQFSFEHGLPWYLAGFFGTVVGSVWNYGVTSVFTWKLHGRRGFD